MEKIAYTTITMASGDTVQRIKDTLSIVDVISSYVELHKAGRHYKGKSPFTNEKTPSFYVSPERGMYYCFSTNQGGDIFTFMQTMEGVDFKQALQLLAEKAHIELVPESPQKRTEREQLLQVLQAASEWFTSNLKQHTESHQYLEQRGLSDTTIKNWSIGYAPGPPQAGWRELRTALTKQGYKEADMLRAGLIKSGQSGKEPFDVFRDRIMFPMRDQGGHVVAFSGRLLGPNTEAPKYVNSPETELYHKSSFLFGYDKAKQTARTKDFWLLVEGQFDVVLAHQAGYTNTVAVSGTAFTMQHLQLLERLSSRIVLALDADRAGIAAIEKIGHAMLRRGMDVKVVALPSGQDPADCILADANAFKKAVGAATHVIEFLLDHIMDTEEDLRTQKLRAHDRLIPLIAAIPNRLDQEHFESVVSERLDTTKDAVHFELERYRERLVTDTKTPDTATTSVTSAQTPNTSVDSLHEQRDQALVRNYQYLYVMQSLVPVPVQEKLQAEIQDIPGFATDDFTSYVQPEFVSKLTFELEKFMHEQSERIIFEDLSHRLHQFRTSFLKQKLRDLREHIAGLERLGEDPPGDLLEQILYMQRALQREPCTFESFLG